MSRRWSITLAACMAAILNTSPASAADVGISVNVGQPGFYGRIDIGNFPAPPPVIYPQPVIMAPAPVAVVQRPIYLRVPPGHARNWSRHCGHYNACGQHTYFVQDDWYQRVYVPARGIMTIIIRHLGTRRPVAIATTTTRARSSRLPP